MNKLDRFIDVISLIVIFSCMIYMVLLLLKNINLKQRLDQIPKDITSKQDLEAAVGFVKKYNKQLIQVNDTLYYRIHVRIDTTYFVRK